jgi:uncharacterized protein
VKPLLVNVDEIKDSAQPWEGDLAREDLDELLLADPPTEFHGAGAAHVRANLTRMGRKVLARAAFTVPLQGLCRRCLKTVTLDEPVDLTLTYVPAPAEPRAAPREGEHTHPKGKEAGHRAKPMHQQGESAASFDPETADEELYSGKSFDLAPALREAVLLAVPPSPLCTDDCKGLCLTCGQDLNQRDCGHSQRRADPRWEALKKLKLEPKQESKKE